MTKKKKLIRLNEINERSWVEINLSNFSHNLKELKKHMQNKQFFMQIVKADAYGHGALQIANQAIKEGATILGVANVEEASLLRFHNIEHPILILSPSFDFEIEAIISNKLTPSIANLHFAKLLNEHAKEMGIIQSVHIKYDTGMNRNGIRIENALDFYQTIEMLENIKIEGIFSHFSSSEVDKDFTQKQYLLFAEFASKVAQKVHYIHIANSSAIIDNQFELCNLNRIGLLSYGVYSSAQLKNKIDLKPVMTFKSKIAHISTAHKNESVGYNRTHFVDKDSHFAIIPIGYADGYDYLLSDKGLVEINGSVCPVLGKISMDMIAIDINQVDNVKVDDEVILLGGNTTSTKVENLSALFNGSSYELLTQIGKRAKRYYIEDGKINDYAPILRRDFIPRDFSDDKLNLIIHQAIQERINKQELASVIYHDVLRYFFIENDRDVSYRSDFTYNIKFIDNHINYYKVELNLSFDKILQNTYFIVACANNQANLESYFRRKDTEYRWLLDESIELDESKFSVSSAKVNGVFLDCFVAHNNKAIEVKCESDKLESFLNKLAHFEIKISTYYPKNKHQLSVYLSEIYKGVSIQFTYPESISNIDCVPIFSGRHRYPKITQNKGSITVASEKNDWIFPNSGVVFSY